MQNLKVVRFALFFVLSFHYLNGLAIISSKKHEEDALPCLVCDKAVEMTRDNIFASCSDIKVGMINYCQSIYSQYKNNCLYIVNNYISDIYTKARVTLYSMEAICVNEGLCSDKNHHFG